MLLAEIDPIQVVIIVIAMGAGFVQWLWGLFKQGQEEAERRKADLPSPEERAAREQAWRRQVEQTGQPPRPSPKASPPLNPWDTVRDVVEQIKEEARKAQSPAAPPPIPQRPNSPPPPTSRPRSYTVRAELRPTPVPPPTPAAPFPTAPVTTSSASTPPVFFAQPPTPAKLSPSPDQTLPRSRPELNGLRQLLQTPATLRQAVLLREILGPPKALQSAEDSPF